MNTETSYQIRLQGMVLAADGTFQPYWILEPVPSENEGISRTTPATEKES